MDVQEISPSVLQTSKEVLNKWIFDTIHPYLRGKILEINSGSGSISSFFAAQEIPIQLSDPDKSNRDNLRERFKEVSTIKAVHKIDTNHTDFKQRYAVLASEFDTVLALNISEPKFHDEKAIRNEKFLLNKRGHLMILIPAYTTLYPGLDFEPNDWKKYNYKSIKAFLNNDMEILKTRYFNLVQFGLSAIVVAKQIS